MLVEQVSIVTSTEQIYDQSKGNNKHAKLPADWYYQHTTHIVLHIVSEPNRMLYYRGMLTFLYNTKTFAKIMRIIYESVL